MLKFIGVMIVCGILSMFFGPLPFIIALVVYLVKWIMGRR